MGFSNLDKAGMLIEGFNEMGTMITLYNYPYYPKHLKKHGYKKEAVWIEYEIKIASSENAPEKIKKFSNLILKRYNLKALNFKKKNLFHIVITGLGNKSEGGEFFTGKIRKQFPQWLETEPFQQIVKSYSPCKIKHGGLGAFYVKLRVKE